jgi:hypothetical protein
MESVAVGASAVGRCPSGVVEVLGLSTWGIWSNRTRPVGPYPSQVDSSSGDSDSGQHSQSIASARKSSVILLTSQYILMT